MQSTKATAVLAERPLAANDNDSITMVRVAPHRSVNAASAKLLGFRGEPAYEWPAEGHNVAAKFAPTFTTERPGATNDNATPWNRWDNLPEGHRFYSAADTVKDLKSAPASDSHTSNGRGRRWNGEKWVRVRRAADRAVFDAAQDMPRLVEKDGDWKPPRMRGKKGVPVFRFGIDGPEIEHRLNAQAAWITSNRYRDQLVNDNIDWPLAKLLRAERNDHCLGLAERYRELHDAVHLPWGLVGKDMSDNVYLMADTRLDESTGELIDKGVKRVTGRKATLDEPGTRAVAADPDKTKKRAKPVPREWKGDWPLLHKIDASRELEEAQAALGWLMEALEAAVVYSETLETIGRVHGVGNQAGAKGAGRALVFLGLQCLDQFWKDMERNGGPRHKAKPHPNWVPGEPVPDGYYRSALKYYRPAIYPDMIFRRAA